MENMHAKNHYHRDLEPENILLTEDELGELQVRMIDFGAHCEGAKASQTTIEKQLWICPEVREGKGFFGAKSEIHGVGMLLYYTVWQKEPFENLADAI
jgi:serine/threonine protein kinase